MTDSKSSKIKEWQDTHYPIHIPMICLVIGVMLTIFISNTWLEPERLTKLKEVCPSMSEDCLNRLAWEPSPLIWFIPLSFVAGGFIIGNAIRITA